MSHAAEPLFRPRSIAIIGASDSSRGGWSEHLFQNLQFTQPDARVFLVNPRRQELWGHPVYPNFSAIGEPVDLGLSVIPASSVVETLTEAAQHGLKCALIYAAQFGEGGDEEGLARANALLSLRDRFGIRFSGPNCMGSLALREGLLMYPAPRVRSVRTGSVGVVFQSGGTFQYWLQQATVRGLGFSYAVSSGNEMDLAAADYIDFLVGDENTRVIACLLEGIRKPDAFMAAAARALDAGKPIVLVKSGRSARGKEAASSHTGALAGDDDVFNAMCRAYGIVRCETLDDMIETCLAFDAGRLPERPGAAIVTYSGSSKGLMLDYADDAGLDLADLSPATLEALAPQLDAGLTPENPLDTGATVARQPKRFSEICRTIAADDNVGMLLIQGSLPASPFDNQDPQAFTAISSATGKPVLAWSRMAQNVTEDAVTFQRNAGLPFLQGMATTAHAGARLARYVAARRRGPPKALSAAGKTAPAAQDMGLMLDRHGLTTPRSRFARNAEAAGVAAREIGYPVALKIVSADALHKTEVGGVALGLMDEAAVIAAAKSMRSRLLQHHANAVVDGFLVQEMVSGLELIVGARRDPIYGPLVMVGLGGVQAEVLRDTAISLLPLVEGDAERMLMSLRGRALLGSFRGRPARDVAAAVRAIEGLAEFFAQNRDHFDDIEVNPLMVLEEGAGVRAVDVRMIPGERKE